MNPLPDFPCWRALFIKGEAQTFALQEGVVFGSFPYAAKRWTSGWWRGASDHHGAVFPLSRSLSEGYHRHAYVLPYHPGALNSTSDHNVSVQILLIHVFYVDMDTFYSFLRCSVPGSFARGGYLCVTGNEGNSSLLSTCRLQSAHCFSCVC